MVLHRNLGPFDTTAIGLGEMPLTIENNLGPKMGVETIHAALDAGCRQIDTAWAYYCSGGEEQTGEKLVREALASWDGPRDEVLVATKVGHFRTSPTANPPGMWTAARRPDQTRQAERIRTRCRHDRPAVLPRPDPKIPYGESCEAMKEIRSMGIAREIGISNASIEQIDIAREILGDSLIAVQNQFSADLHRDSRHTRLLRQGGG